MSDDIRQTARVLVLNAKNEIYLLCGKDPGEPDRAPFWYTPGGKIDPGETEAEAAARELFEEVGLVARPEDLGPVVAREDITYRFNGQHYRQASVFYAYRSETAGLNSEHWTELERQTIEQAKWWTLDALKATKETIFPPDLAQILADLTRPD